MSHEQQSGAGHKSRIAVWVAAATGAWLLTVASGGCGVTSPGQSTPLDTASSEVNGGGPVGPAGTDAGTIPWHGDCTADSDCDQAAATLCGDHMEMYCKFPTKKDGGPASQGTCECRETKPQVKDAGVVMPPPPPGGGAP